MPSPVRSGTSHRSVDSLRESTNYALQYDPVASIQPGSSQRVFFLSLLYRPAGIDPLPFIIQEGIVEEETNRAEAGAVFYGRTGTIFQTVFSVIPLGGQGLNEGVTDSPRMPGGRTKVVDSCFGPLAGCVPCWP